MHKEVQKKHRKSDRHCGFNHPLAGQHPSLRYNSSKNFKKTLLLSLQTTTPKLKLDDTLLSHAVPFLHLDLKPEGFECGVICHVHRGTINQNSSRAMRYKC